MQHRGRLGGFLGVLAIGVGVHSFVQAEDPKPPLVIESTPSAVARKNRVIIDPGHGGIDTGAKGEGIFEKSVVLEVALRAKKILEGEGTFEIILTRDTDVFVPLSQRTSLANEKNADLFISLHANASPKKNAQGLETFYLDTTNDKASRTLAERENASLKFENGTEGDIAFILSDLIQTGKLEDSIKLAHAVHQELKANSRAYWGEAKDLGVKKGPFYVLVGAHMPCILVELFFIDHPVDGKYLADSSFQLSLGQGLAEGIRAYFKSHVTAR
jgi:N-acetylmuramoyl-L-alanine amidase